ncbi:UDP-glucose 4-epimerase GalE [Camelimonas abortus]|uniref:UDP-glucose 4-epimerase n=1 Tax=Camelimonas abortus TaxID=1017184 RepID=A0ABV7LAR1_9HYPH
MTAARVLVTGGAGYIGSHTVLELLARGHDVCVVDSFANSSPEAMRRVAALAGRAVRVERADMRDLAAVTRLCARYRPDVVIHFAGLKAVDEAERAPLDYYDVNVSGTINVLKAMAAAGCRRIIFSSSATVYGEPRYLPLDEAHPCLPAGVYGRTKLAAETVLRDWARVTPECSCVILRYFNPVGAHASGRIGEAPRDAPNNLMPIIAEVAVGRRAELCIYGDDWDTRDGTGLRDYIHVVDLAAAHVAALDFALAAPRGAETFNIGSGAGATVREVLAAYERACGRRLPCRVAGRRPGDIAAYYANPGKAERTLGWRARHSLDDMCRSSWNWQSRNPDGYGA